ALLANSTRLITQTATSSVEYKKYDTPFTANPTSNGIEIFSDANYTGDVYIDLASMDLTNNLAENYFAVPLGTVLAFSGSSIPDNYEIADGGCLDKTEFSNYFSVAGIAHGECDAGSGAGSGFNKPDLRGKFIRAIDGG